MVNMCDVLHLKLVQRVSQVVFMRGEMTPRTGEGKCSRPAAIFSPGDSIATTGTPNVTPSRDARAPPNECPVIQILD